MFLASSVRCRCPIHLRRWEFNKDVNVDVVTTFFEFSVRSFVRYSPITTVTGPNISPNIFLPKVIRLIYDPCFCTAVYHWTYNCFILFTLSCCRFFLDFNTFLYINVKITIYRNIILPAVLYGCQIWSFTSEEERKLRVFENRVLRRIYGPKWDEVTGEWRRLHNGELYALYSSLNIIRVSN